MSGVFSDLTDDGFAENLAHGRVREHDFCHVLAGELALHRDGHAVDHFGAGIAHDAGADDDAVLIEEHFDEASRQAVLDMRDDINSIF